MQTIFPLGRTLSASNLDRTAERWERNLLQSKILRCILTFSSAKICELFKWALRLALSIIAKKLRLF